MVLITCKHCTQGFVLCQLHLDGSVALTLTATMGVWGSAVQYVLSFSMGYHPIAYPSLEQLGWTCRKCGKGSKLDGCIGLSSGGMDMWPRLVSISILLRYVDIESYIQNHGKVLNPKIDDGHHTIMQWIAAYRVSGIITRTARNRSLIGSIRLHC